MNQTCVPPAARRIFLGGILLLAAVVRFANLAEPSLWYDEARTYHGAKPEADLIDGLLHGGYSVGPLGMLHFRLAIAWTDGSEWWLRLPSVLAGMGVVYMLWVLGLAFGGVTAAALAAFGGAVANGFVVYSREFRHYSTEMLLTLMLIYLAERIIRCGRNFPASTRWKAIYLGAAIVSLLYSWAPIFVLATTAVWLILYSRRQQGWSGAWRMVLWHLPVGVAFLLLYLFVARAQAGSGNYHRFWAEYMYGGLNPAPFLAWLSESTKSMCNLAFGSMPWYLVMLLTLSGILRLILTGQALRLIPLLGSPFLLMFLGALRLYPYGVRPGMYAMGPWMLLMSLGAASLIEFPDARVGEWLHRSQR